MTIKVQHVDPNYIHQVWPLVMPWLLPVFEVIGDSSYYTIDNLKEYIIRGEHVLLIGIDELEVVRGAVTVQWCNYPNARIAYVSAFGASLGNEVEQYTTFISWLKTMGTTRVECTAPPTVARLLRQKMGFVKSPLITMELDI